MWLFGQYCDIYILSLDPIVLSVLEITAEVVNTFILESYVNLTVTK